MLKNLKSDANKTGGIGRIKIDPWKVYERASQIGGQWAGLRTDLVEDYGHRHSSLYHGLWINGPKEAGIELPNYQFDKDIPSYFKQPQMVKYLEGYIDHMKIRQKFHVSMNVIKVSTVWAWLIPNES